MQPTHLQVGISPRNASRALWLIGSLFAVSSGVAVCLTLLFLFRPSGPAQSPRPPLSTGLLVVPTDFPTIQEAVAAAKEGSTIRVRPGEYREWVTISKPVHLEAEPSGEVSLVAPSDASPALSVTDTRGVRVSGFRLRHPAGKPAEEDRPPVVELRRSEAILTGCEIGGGAEDGLRCSGEGRVRLENCDLSGNALHGLNTERGAKVEALGCRFERNGGSGLLVLLGAAELVATDCRLAANGASGAEVNRGGKATFERCEFSENAKAGMLVDGVSCEVTVLNGLFKANRVHGIQVANGGLLRLSDCVVEGNQETGVALYDPATGCTVSGGRFRNNGHFGILLEAKEEIKAEIEGVDASDNGFSGIVVDGPVIVKARKNVSVGNDECGILLMSGVGGEVVGNRCQRNSRHGIALDNVSESLRCDEDANESSDNRGKDFFRR